MLTDSEQQASIVLRYSLPADATVMSFVIAFETSVSTVSITPDDIRAAFPDAKVTNQGGGYSWSAIAHHAASRGGPSPLTPDGREHVLELTIPIPTEAAYDEQGSGRFGGTGWLWSYFSPPPFAILDQPPTLFIQFESSGTNRLVIASYRNGAYTAQACPD